MRKQLHVAGATRLMLIISTMRLGQRRECASRSRGVLLDLVGRRLVESLAVVVRSERGGMRGLVSDVLVTCNNVGER
jgi:hypothetical protein